MDCLYNFCAPGQTPLSFTASPIWMLGQCYDHDDSDAQPPTFQRFLADFSQKLWFSYRRDFPAIGTTAYTSDAGWGCMLRTGQMVLAQALLTQLLGRDWKSDGASALPELFLQIVRWFADTPSAESPYSIHAIAIAGQSLGKAIGEWLGPSTIAHVLSQLVASHAAANLSVYVSDDGAVYQDQLFHNHDNKGAFIIIPLRLGVDTTNEIYYQPILRTLQLPQSLGIIGGKPRASLYFIAAQDENVFYLDPHVIQPAVSPEGDFPIDSYHWSTPKMMHVSEIDPSLALAFYCKDKADFDDFCHRTQELSRLYPDSPLFTVAHKSPNYKEGIMMDEEEEEIEMDMDMVVL